MRRKPSRSDISQAVLVGAAAGLVAAFAMNAFQAAVSHFEPDDQGGSDDEPATEKAADRIAALAGTSLSDDSRPVVGNAIHYALGALLGAGYAVAAEYEPRVTAGAGAAFGMGTAIVLDEGAVPAAGLSAAPWEFPLATHLYGLSSHFVFGTTTDAVRRVLRRF